MSREFWILNKGSGGRTAHKELYIHRTTPWAKRVEIVSDFFHTSPVEIYRTLAEMEKLLTTGEGTVEEMKRARIKSWYSLFRKKLVNQGISPIHSVRLMGFFSDEIARQQDPEGHYNLRRAYWLKLISPQ